MCVWGGGGVWGEMPATTISGDDHNDDDEDQIDDDDHHSDHDHFMISFVNRMG